MAGSPKKSLALDANLLLDLAEERDFAHEFREEFQGRGYSFAVPPTALAEYLTPVHPVHPKGLLRALR